MRHKHGADPRYIKRKQEQEAAAAATKAEKTIKLKKEMSETDMLFGDIIQPIKAKKDRKPMSPRVFAGADRAMQPAKSSANGKADLEIPTEASAGTGMEGYREPPSGMGVRDEAMGLVSGGAGSKDVGMLHEDS